MADNVVYPGVRVTVRWAIEKSGKMRAEEYFDKLTDSQQESIVLLSERLDIEGRIWDPRQFKKLKGTALREFKRPKVRMLCFKAKCGSIIITHGFYKKQDETPLGEIKRGERIMKEHEERCDGCGGQECL